MSAWGLHRAPSVASQMELPSTVPRVVKFTSGLSAVVAEEGREATFQCIVSPSNAVVTWYRDGIQLQPSEKFVMAQSGASQHDHLGPGTGGCWRGYSGG